MAAALRIGTRGSALALVQARAMAAALEALGRPVELVTIETSGDRASRGAARTDRSEASGGDKARFVKEIEAALLAGEVDLAVHSAKDVPGELPDGLAIVGVPGREDARDALCLAPHIARAGGARAALDALPEGAVVGTASPRRRAQLLAARPDLDVRELRGNVDTRLGRLAEGNLDAALLAVAGLSRLGRAGAGVPLAVTAAVPAAGQGCLALEARADDTATAALAQRLTDPAAATALAAERALVVALGADCHTPVGAHATIAGGAVSIESFVGAPDGSTWIRDTASGAADDPEAAGRAAAERLVAAGAEAILAAARA
ncbi:MAG: hydroxymethylbilane synthase [Solirubrobacterales bacterium]|nr:hydroxymethylbilane synthase [Solirubrobacterales bacterium]